MCGANIFWAALDRYAAFSPLHLFQRAQACSSAPPEEFEVSLKNEDSAEQLCRPSALNRKVNAAFHSIPRE